MKAFLSITAAILTAIGASGQGQINFNNRVTTAGGVVAPVYGPVAKGEDPLRPPPGNATTNGNPVDLSRYPRPQGTNWTAQLWYGPWGSSMDALQATTHPSGIVPFRSTAATAGFIQNRAAAVTLDGIPYGSRAALQMRVWDNRGGLITSWAAAIADPSVATGYSDVFTSLVLAAPPESPPPMVGLTSFFVIIPEPSVFALAALGLSALALRRRRN